jgi:hypothetical protein
MSVFPTIEKIDDNRGRNVRCHLCHKKLSFVSRKVGYTDKMYKITLNGHQKIFLCAECLHQFHSNLTAFLEKDKLFEVHTNIFEELGVRRL